MTKKKTPHPKDVNRKEVNEAIKRVGKKRIARGVPTSKVPKPKRK